MKKTAIVLIFLLSVITFSCVYGTDNFLYYGNKVENRVDYVHELKDFEKKIKSDSLSEKYRILVLTDVHFGSPKKETETERFFTWLKQLDKNDKNFPKFCFILGDNVDYGYKNQYETYCSFVNKIEKEGIPVITIIGNHDIYNSGWDNFKESCYPNCSVFTFKTKGFSWYGIDTGTGDLGIKQYEILKEKFQKDKNPKIILQHYPLTNVKRQGAISFHDSAERNLLVDLFAKSNVKAVLCGHLHMINFADLGAFKEYGHPSFCYSLAPAWTLYDVDESDPKNPTIKQLPRDF